MDNNSTNNTLLHFNALIAKDANEARNFLGFLIGYFKNTNSHDSIEQYSEAFLSLYENFSEDIKKDTDAFSKTFHKYFLFFPLNDTNKKYYDMFNDTWSDMMRDEVRRFNPEYQWDSATYKNAQQLSRVLTEYFYQGNLAKIKEIINNSSSEIQRLTTTSKDKNKFIEHLYKNNGWSYLLRSGLENFKNLCSLIKTNYNEVLCQVIKDANDGLKFLDNLHDDNIVLKQVVEDLLKDDLHKVFNNNFFEASGTKRHAFNILNVFLVLLANNQEKIAVELAEKYPFDIKNCLQPYLYHDNLGKYHKEYESLDFFMTKDMTKIDLLSSDTWSIFLENIYPRTQGTYKETSFSQSLIEHFMNCPISIAKLIEKNSFKHKLDTEITHSNTTKIKSKKI